MIYGVCCCWRALNVSNCQAWSVQVAATPDLMLAYIDVFLGGDEKRPDLPPKLMQRLPMTIIFGGEGSYLAPYSLHSDNLLTSLVGQVKSFVINNRNDVYSFDSQVYVR